MNEERRYQAIQAQIKDLLDAAAKDGPGTGVANLGRTLLAAKMQWLNERARAQSEARSAFLAVLEHRLVGSLRLLTPEQLIEQYAWTLWVKTASTRIKIIDEADMERERSFLDLEGREHEVKLGRCICVGLQGERWTCSVASLERDWKPVSEPDAQGYRHYKMKHPRPVRCFDLPFPFVLLVHDQRWLCEGVQGGIVTWNGELGTHLDMRIIERAIFSQTYERSEQHV